MARIEKQALDIVQHVISVPSVVMTESQEVSAC